MSDMKVENANSTPTFESRLNNLETNFAVFVQEMKDFKEEMKDFKNEMRQQNQMRANEITEIRQSLQSLQASGRNQTLITFLGIAAMVIAVLLK